MNTDASLINCNHSEVMKSLNMMKLLHIIIIEYKVNNYKNDNLLKVQKSSLIPFMNSIISMFNKIMFILKYINCILLKIYEN